MPSQCQPERTLMIVSHTHWDREWYLPFEAFRARLARMMDSLIDLLDRDPGFRHFVMDGQTVPLDDYLEVRPDRRSDIERLVQEGRLLIGPNYMLPDEFLIGGESHIRNLMTGIRAARQYGGAMMVGYSPDAFGHVAHLPAVLRGFGIDSVAIWRGVGREVTASEFRWAAPDGSEVLALHFPYGYGMMAVVPTERQALANALQNVRNLLEPFASTRYVLVPNGTDHLAAHEGLSGVIRAANEMLDDAEVVHGTYPMFVEAVKSEMDGRLDQLPRVEGEFRSSQRSHVLSGVLSTRMWLKQRYQECEDLLARYTEPLVAWAHLLRSANGGPDRRLPTDQGLLRQAWKHLLQNGPHDSVTGCSVDAVYVDVGARFDRCQQIADALLFDAQRYIADRAAAPGGTSIVVFNTEDGPRSDFCTVRLPLEGGQTPGALVGPDGAETPLQVLERGLHSPLDSRERVIAGFVARDVPGYGYRAYRVEYRDTGHETRDMGSAIVNEFFRVTASPDDGTLTVEDLRSGAVLRGLNRFVDGGDGGDEYNYCPPDADEIIDRPSRPAEALVTESGPARWTLEVSQAYELPARLSEDRRGRSAERVEYRIVSRVRLYPGVPRVDIETEVENRAEDHRLRVHFPSGLRSEFSWAEQHFGVVRRPVDLPPEQPGDFETPIGTYPQRSFVCVSDGSRGLTVANRGLPEYEALEEAGGTTTIALTLLRCVGWLSRSDLSTRRGPAGPPMATPGAQLPGRWTLHYSLLPHEGAAPAGGQGWESAWREARRFARPLRAVRTGRGAGSMPLEGALVEIEPPELVLSALKLAEEGDGVVVRVYNTADSPVEGRLRLRGGQAGPFVGIETVDLNEESPAEAEVDGEWVRLSARRNQIFSVKFRTGVE